MLQNHSHGTTPQNFAFSPSHLTEKASHRIHELKKRYGKIHTHDLVACYDQAIDEADEIFLKTHPQKPSAKNFFLLEEEERQAIKSAYSKIFAERFMLHLEKHFWEINQSAPLTLPLVFQYLEPRIPVKGAPVLTINDFHLAGRVKCTSPVLEVLTAYLQRSAPTPELYNRYAATLLLAKPHKGRDIALRKQKRLLQAEARLALDILAPVLAERIGQFKTKANLIEDEDFFALLQDAATHLGEPQGAIRFRHRISFRKNPFWGSRKGLGTKAKIQSYPLPQPQTLPPLSQGKEQGVGVNKLQS